MGDREGDDVRGEGRDDAVRGNFVEGKAGKGVHLLTHDVAAQRGEGTAPTWLYGDREGFRPKDYGLKPKDVPEIAWDPDERTISLINATKATTKFFYISVYHKCVGQNGATLDDAPTTPPPDHPEWPPRCATFAVALQPRSMVALCQLPDVPTEADFSDLRISSDVQTFEPTPADLPDALENAPTLAFPLHPPDKPFVCTQGFGGALTHCMSASTFHAVDFAADVGTPCVAAGDGVVIEIRDSTPEARASGVGVHTLFEWNALSIELDNTADESAGLPPLVCEYVHIREGSARCKLGDRVRAGQVVCETGSVGFTPEPHLHFQLTRGSTKKARTVPFRFAPSNGGAPFVPVAGIAYCAAGPAALHVTTNGI